MKAVPENRLEALVGAAVLLVAGVFLFLLLSTSDDVQFNDRYSLIAEFTSAEGIDIGSDVRLAGIKIGSVRGLVINEETYGADVELLIRGDLELAADSMFAVASESFLGGYFIEILPGVDDEYLQPGERVLNTQARIDFWSTLTVLAEPDREPNW